MKNLKNLSLRFVFLLLFALFFLLNSGCCTFFPHHENCPPQPKIHQNLLDFGTAESQKYFRIINNGGGSLGWEIPNKPEWISCNPTTGDGVKYLNDQNITVTLDRSILPEGENRGKITVLFSPGGAQYIDVIAQKVPNTLEYTIKVSTSDIKHAGTNANVYIELWGVLNGEQTYSGKFGLDNEGHNDFERGHTDSFRRTLKNLGKITKVCIEHDNSGRHSGWHLSSVEIISSQGKSWRFPFNQWLADDEPPYSLRACRTK